jgi:plasmid stability protein
MHKNLQVRHVPEDVHRTLKVRAARAGLTLSDYLLHEIIVIARRPTLDDVLERIRGRSSVRRPMGAAAAVRAEREGRK